MEVKEVVETATRNTKFEIEHQQLRCINTMNELKPGTPEYQAAAESLKTVTTPKNEEDKAKLEIVKVFAGTAAVLIAQFGLRWGIEKALDPHFRDLAKPITDQIKSVFRH